MFWICIFSLLAIFFIWGVIDNFILSGIAHDVLKDFDFEKEKKEILSIGYIIKNRSIDCPLCDEKYPVKDGVILKSIDHDHSKEIS